MGRIRETMSGTLDYIKRAYQENEETMKQERIYQTARKQQQLKQQQQLQYLQPFPMGLNNAQATDIQDYLYNYPNLYGSNILLSQQQIVMIVTYFVNQVIIHNDVGTLSTLHSIMLSQGLDFNLNYLRQIHKDLFYNFLGAYYKELTYESCVPVGALFSMAGTRFGFCYQLPTDCGFSQKQIQTDFKRFLSTAVAQQFLNYYKLQCQWIGFDKTTNRVIISF